MRRVPLGGRMYHRRMRQRALTALATLPAVIWSVGCAGSGPERDGAADPAGAVPAVEVVRLPDGGMQPETAVDSSGVVHLVYLAGDPDAADVFYVRSADGGATFSAPVRVNSVPGSAIASGTIRGAQVAVTPTGRVHVVWNGNEAMPPGDHHADESRGQPGMRMLYARSNADATGFELQRDLMTQTTLLDGGGAVAADAHGTVFVAWHGAGPDATESEAMRRVWLTRSRDDGETFGPERAVSPARGGACSCCSMRMAATRDELRLLYRSALELVHRDIQELTSRDGGETFAQERLHEWEIGACPLTSMSIAADAAAGHVVRAWETANKVYLAVDGSAAVEAPRRASAEGARKHPRLAVGPDGTIALAWTEGTAFGRGGAAAWQVFTSDLTPIGGQGVQTGLPAFDFAAIVRRPQGGFSVIY
jgi:hypothetical protein